MDASVHGLTLPRLANPKVRRCQLGNLATPPKERLGVTTLTRLGDGLIHIVLHRWKRLEVRIEDLGRLGDRNIEPLAQPVGLHAVCQSVADHLRLRTLFDADIFWGHVEDARRGRAMDVVAGFER